MALNLNVSNVARYLMHIEVMQTSRVRAKPANPELEQTLSVTRRHLPGLE